MQKTKVVVATRKSELALAQCRQFLRRLEQAHPRLELSELHVVTTGDEIVDRPLADIGGKGLFLKEIEEALLDGRADFAVHSLKDVPPDVHPDLCLAAIPEREDPRDVLVSRSGLGLMALPAGSVIGTSSLRRALQLRELRPDISVVPIRGNVGTRIQKCLDGVVDATVLARAGMNRLGFEHKITETLSVEQSLPAVGQGALVIEMRRADVELAALVRTLEHADTMLCVEAERGVMSAVEGDCKTPVAAYAERRGDEIWLRTLLAEDGRENSTVRREVTQPFPRDREAAHALGSSLGRQLREDLANKLALG